MGVMLLYKHMDTMTIVRRDHSPLSTYRPSSIDEQFGRIVENMFEDFFTPLMPYATFSKHDGDMAVNPRLNIAETDKAFEVEVELPGIAKEDIKVAIDNRRITIEADAKQESAQKEGEHIVYAERVTRKFARSFTLPADVDDAGAQAKLENGILMLTLPKKEAGHAKRLTID
jgi:HSP20 family protein